MNRSRKWKYVEQEAVRLAAVGLSNSEIAERLGVNGSTVRRWKQAGKLGVTRAKVAGRDPVTDESEADGGQTPEQWAVWVRKTFSLDQTDEQMVTNAQIALSMAQDPNRSDTVRLAAMNQYRSLVKQLALAARAELGKGTAEPEAPKRPTLRVVPKRDPRAGLLAVNE